MNFADLYRHANQLGAGPIRVLALTQFVSRSAIVGRVDYYGVKLDENISLGHMVLEYDRAAGYEEEYVDASIRYSVELNRCWRRLVCCKELMHVFDGRTERVNTRDRFIQLMQELETKPLPADTSDMYQSERDAMWKALLVLCPRHVRDQILAGYNGDAIDNARIADRLKIPLQAVRPIVGDYYLTALERLTGESLLRGRPAPAPWA